MLQTTASNGEDTTPQNGNNQFINKMGVRLIWYDCINVW